MRTVETLLERYFERFQPLGIALVVSGSVAISFGRPSSFVVSRLTSTDGFTELCIDTLEAKIFACTVGRDRLLIGQFPLPSEGNSQFDTPASFVRLAVTIQQEITGRGAGPRSPSAEVPAKLPRTPSPRSLAAEAELKDEGV